VEMTEKSGKDRKVAKTEKWQSGNDREKWQSSTSQQK